jgi:hypothetical protein
MRTLPLAMLVLVACGGSAPVPSAPPAPCETTAAPVPAPAARADKPRSEELDKLAEKRMVLTREWIELLRRRYETGSLPLSDLLTAKREVALAARDSLRGDALRAVLAEYVEDTKKLHALVRTRYPRVAADDDVKHAESRVAEAEYWAAEAKTRD